MTLTASHALAQLIHADLGCYGDTAFAACLEDLSTSRSSLVGIAVASEQIIEGFDPELLSIEEMAARSKRFAMEFREARYYLCRDGKARTVDHTEFFGLLWFRIIEREKKKVGSYGLEKSV